METKEVFAGKIISKTMLTKPHQKEKVNFKQVNFAKETHLKGF